MMTGLTALWIPIVVSAVLVFIASSILHMALPWHKNDVRAVPDEKRFRDAVRPLAIPPGDYVVPRPATMADCKTPEYDAKMREGPVMVFTVMPNGPMTMNRSLLQWFVFCIVVSILSAYVAGAALPPGTPYLRVFQIAGATAFIGHAVAAWPSSIWYARAWSTTIKMTIDALIFALLTAGTFGWLWPH